MQCCKLLVRYTSHVAKRGVANEIDVDAQAWTRVRKTTECHRGDCASCAHYRGRAPWTRCVLIMLRTTKCHRGACATLAHYRGRGPWAMCALIMPKTTKCHRGVCASFAHYRGCGPWAMCALRMLKTTKYHSGGLRIACALQRALPMGHVCSQNAQNH